MSLSIHMVVWWPVSVRSLKLSNAEPGQYLDGWRVLESCCWPCVEVLGMPLISCRLCPPSSDGYVVEWKMENCECISWENALNSPQRRWDQGCKIVKSAELDEISDYKHTHLHSHLHVGHQAIWAYQSARVALPSLQPCFVLLLLSKGKYSESQKLCIDYHTWNDAS